MKKLMVLAALFCLQFSLQAASFGPSVKIHTAPVSATERAKAHFNENFAYVHDVSWYDSPDNGMYCIFHQGNTVNRVFYDQRGYWQFTLISYPASDLKKNVKDLVSGQFGNYQISYINEIRSDYDEPVYMVNIENSDNIKVIKVTGDNIEVKQALVKN